MKELKIDFDEEEITREEATKLISEALSKNNSRDEKEILSDSPKFSQNYRDSDGAWKTVALTAEELVRIRQAHSNHCDQIFQECIDTYPKDKDAQIAMFDKRCDKFFTWLQQALDEKVRQARK